MRLLLNGALLDDEAARIDPADRGFTLGDGVFETIRVAAGALMFLPQHIARLQAGAACLGIPLAEDAAGFATAIARLLQANRLHHAAVRITLTRGPAPRGILPAMAVRPTLLITAAALPPPPPPARAIICRTTRRNQASPLARIKSLNYLDGILARQEAASRGADDAIMLNTAGEVAEATAANLFIIRDGRLRTPPVAAGALPGVMRAHLLATFGALETSLADEDLHQADAIFLTSALGLRPVATLGDTVFDLGNRLLRQLLDAAAKPVVAKN